MLLRGPPGPQSSAVSASNGTALTDWDTIGLHCNELVSGETDGRTGVSECYKGWDDILFTSLLGFFSPELETRALLKFDLTW